MPLSRQWDHDATHAGSTGPPRTHSTFFDLQIGTHSSALTPVEIAQQFAQLSGIRRTLATAAGNEARKLHQNDYMVQFKTLTSSLAGAGGKALLNELSSLGFAWRDIARMVGVSVPAVQKWRHGQGLTGDNARNLARLVAGCRIIEEFNPIIADVAMWFEAPIADEISVSPIDMWASGNYQLVFEHARVDASSETDTSSILDSYDPNWRELANRTAHETFVAGDGKRSIRSRNSAR